MICRDKKELRKERVKIRGILYDLEKNSNVVENAHWELNDEEVKL